MGNFLLMFLFMSAVVKIRFECEARRPGSGQPYTFVLLAISTTKRLTFVE
jgi:hypothetical protein